MNLAFTCLILSKQILYFIAPILQFLISVPLISCCRELDFGEFEPDVEEFIERMTEIVHF